MNFDAVYYAHACNALVEAVRAAAHPECYDIDPAGRAVCLAVHVMREAKRLRLYPQTAQLEAECRRAA